MLSTKAGTHPALRRVPVRRRDPHGDMHGRQSGGVAEIHNHNLKPWEGAQHQALGSRRLPRLKRMVTTIPGPSTTTEIILRMMEGQNTGLRTNLWRMWSRREGPNSVTLVLGIDPASHQLIIVGQNFEGPKQTAQDAGPTTAIAVSEAGEEEKNTDGTEITVALRASSEMPTINPTPHSITTPPPPKETSTHEVAAGSSKELKAAKDTAHPLSGSTPKTGMSRGRPTTAEAMKRTGLLGIQRGSQLLFLQCSLIHV